MSLTARHKKPGGFRKLVNSLETTPPERRLKILEAMRKEDPDFVAEAESCIFTFEDFEKINDLIVCEIVGALNKEMRTFALALFKCEADPIHAKFTKNMNPREMFEFRDWTENLKDVKTYERTAARYRIIEKAREMEQRRVFTLKKYSGTYSNEE